MSGLEGGARDLMADLRASLDAAREVRLKATDRPVVADTTAGEVESLVGVLVRSGVWPLAVAERAAAALAARSGGAQDDGLRARVEALADGWDKGQREARRGYWVRGDAAAGALRRALAGPDDARQDGVG